MPDGLDVREAARQEELVREFGAVRGGGRGCGGCGGDDGFELGAELVLVLGEAGGGDFGGGDAVSPEEQFWGEACGFVRSETDEVEGGGGDLRRHRASTSPSAMATPRSSVYVISL